MTSIATAVGSVAQLLDLYRNDERMAQVAAALEERAARVHLAGTLGSGRALIARTVAAAHRGVHVFVLQDREEAAYFLNDLQALRSPEDDQQQVRSLFFPAPSRSPYDPDGHHDAERVTRTEVLEALSSAVAERTGSSTSSLLIVTWPEALAPVVVTKEALAKNTLTIKRGEQLPIDTLEEWLHEMAFERNEFVYEPGKFSVRGGIVDVFSYGSDQPFRIELYGDTVESVRRFDPQDQLTVEFLKEAVIVPDLQETDGGQRQTFLDQLPAEAILWLHGLQAIGDAANQRLKRLEEAYVRLEEKEKYKEPGQLVAKDSELVKATLGFRKVFWSSSHKPQEAWGSRLEATNIDFSLKPQPAFAKDFKVLSGDLHNKRNAGYTNIIACNSAKQIERLYAIFKDLEHGAAFTPLLLDLHEGFVDPDQKLALYTDHQIFERYHRYRLKEGFRKNAQALTLKELTQLKPGDLVVHIDHGIGVFSGLETIETPRGPGEPPIRQEAIRLKYRDNDILYVGIHSLHRVSKYSGEEDGKAPAVSKLGSPAWKNLKDKTKKKIKALAFDLIKLYAKRKEIPGHAFPPDSYLQHELEASFIYEDTPDQEKATADVKRDMERPVPMDRLVCGDVGFGKTEVAIRAAFKAASEGKQVAVLVPTTILALQHWKTFSERLKDLPVRVDYINRFRTAGATKEILEDLKEGRTDILIGTHRLVSKDVVYKDLGLLIIDEEQKFGVNVKDKLKILRATVDTLTLTATPIPRTLQFSLMGARDLSIISTPPPNRYPVTTLLQPYDEVTIRGAIEYELSRGGQVYFLHDKVKNIEHIADMIRKLVPGVKVGVGHGQLEGHKLEQVMMDFIEGETDVLVCTTIVENGLEIPNANTIIINEAQNFGLSDLHQMRGRVGRTNKKAYCYLLAPSPHLLPDLSRKRLQAIEQFSDLGSGIHIAMKDLDIRGAGDLLGAEQSGFINDIGFETYHKILEEAVRELKDEHFKELFADAQEGNALARGSRRDQSDDCIIETDLTMLIPNSYVSETAERLALYRRLDDIKDEAELQAFATEVQDRFGPIPHEVQELMEGIRLRWLGQRMGLEKMVLRNGDLRGTFIADQKHGFFESDAFQAVLRAVQAQPRRFKVYEKAGTLRISVQDVKSVQGAMEAMGSVVGSPVATDAIR
jgi:transcription-repair coupling factor (superfamily II helicase)